LLFHALLIVCLLAGTAAVPAATQTKASTATKKTSHSKRKHSTQTSSSAKAPTKPAAKTQPQTASAKSATSTTHKKPTKAVARYSSQQHPTTDRYREIQQALSERGYFEGAPDGDWRPSSIDALKRFQRDQNLDDDGKIGALSLIALGLGPKRAAPATQPSAPQ